MRLDFPKLAIRILRGDSNFLFARAVLFTKRNHFSMPPTYKIQRFALREQKKEKSESLGQQ
jgi:hypothetical protein